MRRALRPRAVLRFLTRPLTLVAILALAALALGALFGPFGFRSSFRDWCGERTSFPSEVAEHALAHVSGSKVEQAYRRATSFDARKRLMQMWSDYCRMEHTSATVTPIRA